MNKIKPILFVVIPVIILIAAFQYGQNFDTVSSKITDQLSPIDWDEVIPRNIVKNSIPITVQEEVNGKCIVSARYFQQIIEHPYFVRGIELAEKLNFDNGTSTFTIPCDDLAGEKSRLTIWYITKESSEHSTKYEYYITPWTEEEFEP